MGGRDGVRLAERSAGATLLVLIALGAGPIPSAPASAADPSPSAAASVASPAAVAVAPDAVVTIAPDATLTAALPGDDGSGAAVSATATEVALVPVVGPWSTRESISLRGLRAAVAGRGGDFRGVRAAVADLTALGDELGVHPAGSTSTASAGGVVRAVRRDPRVLGLLPAGAVGPGVRALAIDGASLFGTRRIGSLADWPLLVDAAIAGKADDFDPARLWTIVAGGDVVLDRDVYLQAVVHDKGADHPWDGGLARITSRTCCTSYGGPMITARRVSDRGAVRSLLRSADITLVNHEGPAPTDFTFHQDGLVFTFDPALEAGLRRAGIDLVSLANNHIRNAGSRGVLDTIQHVREAGMASVGAGRDLKAAREGTCLPVGGLKVCFLAYVGYDAARNRATAHRAGAAPLRAHLVRSDVARLRRAGADAVIVVPHWGIEYVERPTAEQRRLARVMVAAGADAVLGSHSHVAGTIDLLGRVPVLYSMGNLLFDHPRYERTLEGILAELTFDGHEVVQLTLHPTVLVRFSQLNLLDPAGDGQVVLDRVRRASSRQ